MTTLPADLDLTVEGLTKYLTNAPPAKVEEVTKLVQPYLSKGWLPQPGPQYEAYHSPADELLYGGAAGGGKTDLLLGLASTAHERSLLFRRQATDLDGLWERLEQVTAGRQTTNNNVKKRMVLQDGRIIEGGHLEKPGSERSWQGRPHDLIGVDEGAQVAEFKIAFVTQWLRTTTPGQRVRLVVATNPPLPEIIDGKLHDTGSGDWIIRWWAPWIDDNYPNPAKDGELRWCYMLARGEDLVTVWVDGPGAYDPETGEKVENPTPEQVRAGRVMHAKSRTFIRSLLKDNAFLSGTGYEERLSATPEPMRSMLLAGAFNVRLSDSAMQVIPTNWILLANRRWHEREAVRSKTRQLVLSADIAQGGIDNTTVVGLLEDDTFEEVRRRPGAETPDGPSVVAMLLAERRDRSMLVLDGTGGWAGDTRRTLSDRHQIEAELCIASSKSGAMDRNMQYGFLNLRAELWWAFREALDPDSEYEIALPPDPRLTAQLTAPQYAIKGTTIQIESKDEIRKRLGSSTDDADCVVQAWHYRDEAKMKRLTEPLSITQKLNDPDYDRAGKAGAPVDDFDPLEGW